LRRHDDGRLTHVMASPTPLIGQDSEYQGSLEVFTDISRLRELEMRSDHGQASGSHRPARRRCGPRDQHPPAIRDRQSRIRLYPILPRLVGLIDKYEQALFLASGGKELETARADIEAYRKEHDLEMVLAELPLALSESHAGAERVAAFVRSIKRFAQPETEGRRVIDVNEAVGATMDVARSATQESVVLEMDLDEDLPPLPVRARGFQPGVAVPDPKRRPGRGGVSGTWLRTGPGAGERPGGGQGLGNGRHDNGSGHPTGNSGKDLQSFFTTKDVGKGSGQGLSIAHAIMEKHGGTIRFETEPGRGTSFYLTFPLG